MASILAPAPVTEVRRGPRPTFSVVIPAYQAAATIGDAIASVRAQTVAPLEIIVCDDGSTDDLDGALAPHREVVTLLRQENRGVVAARNALLRAATGEFVAPLDADDVYAPARLERLAELGAARPDLDILATDAHFVVDGLVVGRFSRVTPFAVERQAEAIIDRCFLIIPAMRRERLLAVGGYDEQLRTAEDWDCCIRLILAGSTAGLVDEPLLEYRLRRESLTSRRADTLMDRVRVLDKVAARPGLSPPERRVVRAALSRHRSRALQQVAREAVAEASPAARAHLLAVVRSRDVRLRARAAAAVAAVAPLLAERLLAATFAESTGRPVPVPPDRSS
jgi:Glycosyl transferase family 2